MRIAQLTALSAVALALAVPAAAAPAAPAAEKTIVQTAVDAGQFSTLVSLVQAAGLADALSGPGPFTVFAPTDAAFAKVPKATLDALAADPAKLRAVLRYHVVAGAVPAADVVKLTSARTLNGASVRIRVSGGSVLVNGARVIAPDVRASNGIIHVVDSVLLPPAAAAPTRNIVQTAAAAGSFKTLTALLRQAGLAGTLQGRGPFTVFAPTDAAFARVPKATLAALAKDRHKLRAVLLYHVTAGRVPASRVAQTRRIETLNGKALHVTTPRGSVRIAGARVTKANVRASNGIIHVIDRVLIP